MNQRDREDATLSFARPDGGGAVEETFYPWDLTVKRFAKEGLPAPIAGRVLKPPHSPAEKYLKASHFGGVADYEHWLGLDSVRRACFMLPLRGFRREVREDAEDHILFRDEGGRVINLHRATGVAEHVRYAVAGPEDWAELKELGDAELEQYYREDDIETIYGPLRESCAREGSPVRFFIEGFYWTPRELMGTEALSYAFYDDPQLVHDINGYALEIFMQKLVRVLDVLPVDVLYIMEDISGRNGPFISPGMFEEFVGQYYRKLLPVLRSKGVRHILVDTDGDFGKLIPSFIQVGVDGFLPMDVNAGMDIVAVRKEYPRLKFIGGFNKLCIADGEDAIDREFQRLLPVIRQGGYIPGADHQVAPATSLMHYRYYISRLQEAMLQAGQDLPR